MRPPRSQNDPLLSLVGWVVLGLVVEVQCFSDDFAFCQVIFGAFMLYPINGVLGEANGQGRIFDIHKFTWFTRYLSAPLQAEYVWPSVQKNSYRLPITQLPSKLS